MDEKFHRIYRHKPSNGTGKKLKTSIYVAGATLARQIIGYDATTGNPTQQSVEFDQWDASGMSYRRTYAGAGGTFGGVSETGETDPIGTGVGLDGLAYFEANLPPERDYLLRQPSGFEDMAVHQNGAEIACYEDGVVISCGRAYRNLENGSATPKVHLRQERDPRRKTKPLPAVVFETLGNGRISGGYYDNAGDGTRIDPLTGEEILVVNTGFVQFSFIVPGLWDARSQPQEKRKLTSKELRKIADDIQSIFDNNHGCLTFINGILENAQTDANPIVSKNPLDVLWAVFQQRGIFYDPTEKTTAYASGGIGEGNAKITVPPTRTLHPSVAARASKSLIKDYNRTQELYTAQFVLAEVIHLTGAFSYNDKAMALATADYLPVPRPDFPYKLAEDIGKWSDWWHPKVDNNCSISNVKKSENKRRR